MALVLLTCENLGKVREFETILACGVIFIPICEAQLDFIMEYSSWNSVKMVRNFTFLFKGNTVEAISDFIMEISL